MATRVVLGVLYAVVATVASVLLARFLKEDGMMGDGFDATIRGCLATPTNESLDDVGGLAAVKDELRKIVLLPLKYPDAFFKGPKALHPPRGVLLHGPPGTGKTMLARALASESGVPFVALTSATLESRWYGDTPKLLASAFRLARDEWQPCILFMDEIDGMGRKRSDLDQACVYSFKTELLRNMDGVQDAAVVVLACTNCPDSLDPALRRRFARVAARGQASTRPRCSTFCARCVARSVRGRGRLEGGGQAHDGQDRVGLGVALCRGPVGPPRSRRGRARAAHGQGPGGRLGPLKLCALARVKTPMVITLPLNPASRVVTIRQGCGQLAPITSCICAGSVCGAPV